MKLARTVMPTVPLPIHQLRGPNARPDEPTLERAFEGEETRHLLMVALRVNAFVALPLAIVLTLVTEGWSWKSFGEHLLVVIVFTNVSFLLLNDFYHRVWLRTRRLSQKVIALFALPILGGLSAVLCKGLIDLVAPELLTMSLGRLTLAGTTVTVVSGLAMFIVEDNRRSRRVSEHALEGSRQREKIASDAQNVAEIVALQALIKPHFVFNTLNSVAALIPDEPDKAEETTIRLAKLLRYVVDIQDDMMVTLETEMEIVEAHLEIEKVRLGDRLHYSLDLAKELRKGLIPAMILQPLFENAVEHGVRQRSDPGTVRMKAWLEGAECVIWITDNGPGLSTHHGAGRALRMLHERLDRVYESGYTLSLERDESAGETRAELRFPFTLQEPT